MANVLISVTENGGMRNKKTGRVLMVPHLTRHWFLANFPPGKPFTLCLSEEGPGDIILTRRKVPKELLAARGDRLVRYGVSAGRRLAVQPAMTILTRTVKHYMGEDGPVYVLGEDEIIMCRDGFRNLFKLPPAILYLRALSKDETLALEANHG